MNRDCYISPRDISPSSARWEGGSLSNPIGRHALPADVLNNAIGPIIARWAAAGAALAEWKDGGMADGMEGCGEDEHQLARACQSLFDAINADDADRIDEVLEGLGPLRAGVFDVQFRVAAGEAAFEGGILEFALGCGSWRALGELMHLGMATRRKGALKFMSTLMREIDKAPASQPDLPGWIAAAMRGAEPSDAEAARAVLGSPTLWKLGPRSRAICADAASRVVALSEKGELGEAVPEPDAGRGSNRARL